MYNDLIWHNSIFSAPKNEKIFTSLPKALAKSVSLWSNSTAVICGSKTYSFNDLACRAAGLANEINEVTDKQGPVALVQSISFDAIAAWFACALSGRAFVLLEPDHPPARLIELIQATSCALVLCDQNTSKALANLPNIKLLISDGRLGTLSENKGLRADEPAMIFPTSGSTGQPKLVTYAATTLQAKVQSSIQLMLVPKGARVLIAGSHGNYGFLHHALVFLLSGGSICLINLKAGGFGAVFEAINKYDVQHVRFTPSMFRKLAVLPQAISTLKLLDGVRFSGEPLLTNDLKLALSVLKPTCLIQNIYGSTESALFIWSSHNDQMQAKEPTVPIGRIYPLASYTIRPIENVEGHNGTGELLISSSFNALGDFKDGSINQERFSQKISNINERIYATGDIVRLQPDGTLIHLGRTGRMVKIRGNRVFLTEIENHLLTFPNIIAAAVVKRIEREETVLYGFITTSGTNIEQQHLKIWIASRLPEFMIPRSIEIITEIPLLQGGKVDYTTLHKMLPSLNTETNLKNSTDEPFSLLTQIWDTVLWKGAHKHEGDFLALGGDSLSLMFLSVEIERIFRKKIPIEEFRNNSTLRNLTTILDMESSIIQVEEKEQILARLICKSKNPSKGIALGMPGNGGWAPAFPFKNSGLFQDHDLWVVDYPIQNGKMTQHNRWWKAAIEIVDGIKKGLIPQPRVVFGYSFGGGLAWLVSRLLAGTTKCPEFVVMVDASPLHHLKAFKNQALTKALKLVDHTKLPLVLHIRKAPLSEVEIVKNSIYKWKSEDNILMFVDLPTTSHSDMARWDILAITMEAVTAFLHYQHTTNLWKPKLKTLDLLGVQFYNALNGSQTSLNKLINEFKRNPEIFNIDQLIALSKLVHLKNGYNKSNEFINYAYRKWPYSKIVHYLYRRLRRKPKMLLANNIPIFFPSFIILFETSICKSDKTIHRAPYLKRLLYISFDLLASILLAEWAKYKLKNHRLSRKVVSLYFKLRIK